MKKLVLLIILLSIPTIIFAERIRVAGGGGTAGSATPGGNTTEVQVNVNNTSFAGVPNGAGYLKNDGAGTYSYDTPAGGGNVTNNGTIAENYFIVAGTAETETKNSTYSTTDAVNWNTAYNNYVNKTLLSGYILVGNDTNITTAVNMSGGATINNTGVITITDALHSHTVANLSDASANGRSLISAANYAAMRTLLDLEAGTDFYNISDTLGLQNFTNYYNISVFNESVDDRLGVLIKNTTTITRAYGDAGNNMNFSVVQTALTPEWANVQNSTHYHNATYYTETETLALQNLTNFYNRTEADIAFEAELDNSAGLWAALSDETGTLLAVFSEAPTINNISLGGTPVYPDGSIAEADLDMNNSPANNLIIKYNATGSGKMEWAADATGGAVGKWTVETKTDNYSVLTTDVAKTLVMNAAGTTTFSLPSVAEENVGTWYTFVKIGAGKVIIDAADSDKIADSGAGDTIYNDQTLEVYATITLQLVSETQWAIIGADGIWITTD